MEDITVCPIPNPIKDYQDAVATGRCAIYYMDMGGATLTIVVTYGWVGAKRGSPDAARTDDVLTIIQMQVEALPPGPKLIAGDLDGRPEVFDTITTLTTEYGWTDVGVVAKLCKGEPGQYTRHARWANATPTPRADH